MRATNLIHAAVVAALPAFAANAAESTERTSMPDYCSNRDVNCVLPDGAAPRIVTGGGTPALPNGPTLPTATPTATTATAPANVRGATPFPSTTTGGVTTVVTPPAASTSGTASASGPSVPAVPALPGGIPTLSSGSGPSLPGGVPSIGGNVPTLSTVGTAPGMTSSSTPTGTTAGTSATGSTSGGAAAIGARTAPVSRR